MPDKRMMRLGAFMRPVGIHTAWWRYPGAFPDANFNLKHLVRLAQKLEAGKFDAWFMADHLAVLNMPMAALKRSATVTSFDPMALLPALAMVTERLGLIATGSTTFDAPYHVARRFASLDHVSDGRAGWNIVTTSNPDSALNFGLDDHMDHDERYRRAREFFDVVTGLWDSFADDAFIRDVENGIYFDPERMHVLDHKGKYFKVRGPLNIARPVQGWPLIVQAGASDSGRQLAAETAEMIFSPGGPIADCQSYYNDIKGVRGGKTRPRARENPPGLSGRSWRDRRGGADKTGAVGQSGASGQRHRRLVDRAGCRCVKVRSGRAIAGRPGDQPKQKRTAACDGPCPAG